VSFWHGRGKPPVSRYVFLLNAVDDGYGGLEHRASTALLCTRRQLPRQGDSETSDGYVTLLGLISHEYFHTWNVKRLKPRDFERIDFGHENYTRLLWFFEGFTSYYDDLLLLRAGLIDAPRYLRLLAKTVSAVLATPGRRLQSVAESSFDAWVKYYRSDENTPNATISYYAKGSLVALALDLSLRAGGGTLDQAMRLLWTACGGGAIDEADIAQALQQVPAAHWTRNWPAGCMAPTTCRCARCWRAPASTGRTTVPTWPPSSACASAKARSAASTSRACFAAVRPNALASMPQTNCWPSMAGGCAGWTTRAAGPGLARPSS